MGCGVVMVCLVFELYGLVTFERQGIPKIMDTEVEEENAEAEFFKLVP